MANGYGSSSSSTGQSKTNAQGQAAPAGYHYMPDGSLMADSDHASFIGGQKLSGPCTGFYDNGCCEKCQATIPTTHSCYSFCVQWGICCGIPGGTDPGDPWSNACNDENGIPDWIAFYNCATPHGGISYNPYGVTALPPLMTLSLWKLWTNQFYDLYLPLYMPNEYPQNGLNVDGTTYGSHGVLVEHVNPLFAWISPTNTGMSINTFLDRADAYILHQWDEYTGVQQPNILGCDSFAANRAFHRGEFEGMNSHVSVGDMTTSGVFADHEFTTALTGGAYNPQVHFAWWNRYAKMMFHHQMSRCCVCGGDPDPNPFPARLAAPTGYHFSPDGALVSNIKRDKRFDVKIIKDIDLNFDDISASGENRTFAITGDEGAMFSLEIKNEDGYYYNFQTQTFQATKTGLSNEIIGSYEK